MRFIWEPKDIIGGRRFRDKAGSEEVWMVVYQPNTISAGPTNFYATVSLADGLVTDFVDREVLSETFTKGNYIPLELEDT